MPMPGTADKDAGLILTCCPLKIGVTLIVLCVSSLHVTVTAFFFINTIISANETRTTNTLNLWGMHIKKVFKALQP